MQKYQICRQNTGKEVPSKCNTIFNDKVVDNNLYIYTVQNTNTLSDKNQQKANIIYTCKICDYNTKRKSDYQRHINRNTCVRAKKTGLFYCEVCNYESKFNSNYQKHLTTKKHKKNTEKQQCNTNNTISYNPQKLQISNPYTNDTQDMINVLIQQNQVIRDNLLELANQLKNISNNNAQNNNQTNNIV